MKRALINRRRAAHDIRHSTSGAWNDTLGRFGNDPCHSRTKSDIQQMQTSIKVNCQTCVDVVRISHKKETPSLYINSVGIYVLALVQINIF